MVTSGGGRWALVRNSGYVTMGARSPAEAGFDFCEDELTAVVVS